MPSAAQFLWISGIVLLALLVGVLSISKKGNRVLMGAIGLLLAIIGIDALVSGKIYQRHNGGPPLEGPLAFIGGVAILLVGGYCIFQAFAGQDCSD